ncbi:MarR family winged helix-turn-helix transcriptional regulator [Streptomyces sp. NBC_00687]|uniref:MarR family winged helix-turn-helix transcriptional regulator n=1 Tax=Streptomyces sp. NBC_00687 TaxID=2975807 RepID=UPI002250AFB7|nr:MarR family transcriptional regulator [Streptomyces sp. NBC_00687]MCX4920069.1 MarR family transcriptional regulator [Streptomyces sp. NBC_00687]
MTDWIDPGLGPLHAVARQAGHTAELLDVLWEQDRNAGPPPYVSVSQLRVMYLADRDNGIRMRDLTRLLAAAPPSVTRLIDRLQALGFIERQPCHDNRREVLLHVTRPGREHLAHIRARRDQLLLQALAGMPGHQRAALAEGLAGLQQALASHPILRAVAEDTPPTPTQAGSARAVQHSDIPP